MEQDEDAQPLGLPSIISVLSVHLSSLSLTLGGPDESLVGLKFYHNCAHL